MACLALVPDVHNSRITAFEYINDDIGLSLGRAVIYLDNCSLHVQFQSKEHVTPWHGEWKIEDGSLVMFFDCFAGKQTPRLKSAKFFDTGAHNWVGYDYRGRHVRMQPLSRWSLCDERNVWKKVQEFSTELGWYHVY